MPTDNISTVPLAPNAVPLADMHFIIRMQGQDRAIAAFAYLADAFGLYRRIKDIHSDVAVIYELVDNTTGEVIHATDQPLQPRA